MRLKRAIIVLLIAVVPGVNSSFAQTWISGKIFDSDNASIPGANIYLENSYDGTTSDLNGQYFFKTSKEGQYKLIVSFLGFRDHIAEIELNGDTLVYNVKLREDALELESVVITAGAFEASGEHKREVLKPLDILTTAGATGDIAGALNTLPGTQTVGESGRLFVRGGEAYETKTFIDGFQLMNFYTPSAPNTPGRTRFMPYMFSGTSFSTGGYSAEYGQALSSVLILNSKFKANQNRTDLSLMSVGADIGTSRSWENASLSAKVQYTNLRPYQAIISQDLDWIKVPNSIEASSSFQLQTSNTGVFKFFGHLNSSSFSLYQNDILDPYTQTRIGLDNQYFYTNALYQEEVGKSWNLKLGASFTQNTDQSKFGNTHTDGMERGFHGKLVANNEFNGNLVFKFGIEYFNRFIQKADYLTSESFIKQSDFREEIGSLFAESDIYLTKNLLTRIGLRSEYIGIERSLHFSPRLSIALKTSENTQISAAFGHFNQTPQKEWLIINDLLEQEKASHYILNYQYNTPRRTFRVELYHKNYTDLVDFNLENPQNPHMLSNEGFGFARGFDLFWRDNQTMSGIDYWISYSFLDTKRKYQHYPESVMPSFTSKHNFSFVYKHYISKLKSQLGLSYSFASNRAYHDPNDSEFMGGRTPEYHDLSCNLSYLMRDNVIIHLSASNLLGTKQVFGYEFSSSPNSEGIYLSRVIKPPAKRFIFLGVFITFSKESVLNQLPNL